MIPTGADLAVYNDSRRAEERRVVMEVSAPHWPGKFEDTFSGLIDLTNYRTSMLGTQPSDGEVKSYGARPWEYWLTREHVLPRDLSLPFYIETEATFPQEDPVYDTGIIIYGVDGPFGVPSDPMRIIQHGSVTVPNFAGDARIMTTGFIPDLSGSSDLVIPFDGYPHVYRLEWRPAATDNLELYIDAVKVFDTENGVRPFGVLFGIPWSISDPQATPLGEPGDIATLMEVHRFEVDELDSGGHDSPIWPGWTSENDGATGADDAGPGERFDDDGKTWAILPLSITDMGTNQGISVSEDTFNLTVPADDWPYYEGREVLIDTRVSAGGSDAGWKRQIAGVIEKVDDTETERRARLFTLSGRATLYVAMDDVVHQTYINAAGPVPGANVEHPDGGGFTFSRVFRSILSIASALSGRVLNGDIDAPDIVPLGLNTGTTDLGQQVDEWTDRLVQERWVRYRTSGDAKHGELVVNLFDTEAGDSYEFHRDNTIAISRDSDTRNMPGQVQYQPNLPRGPQTEWWIIGLPGVACYPSAPYPAHAKVVEDSIAYANSLAVGTIVNFPDREGDPRPGGIAKHRLYALLAQGRRITVQAKNHDWIEPGDTIEWQGKDWIVSDIRKSWTRDGLISRADCFSADVLSVLRREL